MQQVMVESYVATDQFYVSIPARNQKYPVEIVRCVFALSSA